MSVRSRYPEIFAPVKRVDPQFAEAIANNLETAYKQYSKIDIESMFQEKEVAEAFDEVCQKAFSGQNYNDALLRYENLTEDHTFRHYLNFYRFCAVEMYPLMLDENGNYNKTEEFKFLTNLGKNCRLGFPSVQPDLEHGNYWWMDTSASALRRQLSESRLIMRKDKFLALCEYYFGRKFDYKKDIYSKDGSLKINLIKELDEKMASRGATCEYAWFKEVNGKRYLKTSKEKPEDGYYFIKYDKELELTRNA